MRVLVAFEESYRSYRETIAAAIKVLRPQLEVDSVVLSGLEEELERFDPHAIVCSRPNRANATGWTAWIEMPVDPLRPAEVFYADGRRREAYGFDVGEMVLVLDEVEGSLPPGEGPSPTSS